MMLIDLDTHEWGVGVVLITAVGLSSYFQFTILILMINARKSSMTLP